MNHNQTSGFTLIELLVAVTIIGLLSAIAYPSYRMQVQQTRRAEVQAELMELAQYLERIYSESGRYNPDTLNLAPTSDYYDIGFVADTLTATTYTLEAVPKDGSSQDGTGALQIDQAQRRFWDENNDGDMDGTGEDNWHRG